MKRKPFTEPELKKLGKLPTITAGSISEGDWGFTIHECLNKR